MDPRVWSKWAGWYSSGTVVHWIETHDGTARCGATPRTLVNAMMNSPARKHPMCRRCRALLALDIERCAS